MTELDPAVVPARRCAAVWGCLAAFGMHLAQGAPPPEPASSGSPGNVPAVAAPAPLSQSRAAYFRELLALSPTQRELELQKRPESKRDQVRRKVDEYLSLPAAERDRRLLALEIHEHLMPLLAMPLPARASALAGVPVPLQSMIEQRLALWDRLPADTQRLCLEHPTTLDIFSNPGGPAPSTATNMADLPPSKRQEMERQLAAWNSIPTDRRNAIADEVQRFLRLSPSEQDRTLNKIGESERERIQRLVQSLEKLPPVERDLCLASLRRFAQMTAAERSTFLRNAERWQAMSPEERRAWQSLVTTLPASLPVPSTNRPAPPLPGASPARR